jgi:hypothetical protein
MRMSHGPLRLTNAFSKKWENHALAEPRQRPYLDRMGIHRLHLRSVSE